MARFVNAQVPQVRGDRCGYAPTRPRPPPGGAARTRSLRPARAEPRHGASRSPDNARGGTGARSRGRPSPTAPRPDGAQAHRLRPGRPRRTRARSRTATASARRPRRPPTPQAAGDPCPHARACAAWRAARGTPCRAAAARSADHRSATATSCAKTGPATAPASRSARPAARPWQSTSRPATRAARTEPTAPATPTRPPHRPLASVLVRRRPCSALGHAYAPRGGPVDCVALGNRSGQERLSPAGRPSPTPAHGRGAVPVVVPSPAHITEPVLRHTALGQCSRDGLHATVCRHRFLSVRSICLASWSTGPRWA